jgi:hypothetical protein
MSVNHNSEKKTLTEIIADNYFMYDMDLLSTG